MVRRAPRKKSVLAVIDGVIDGYFFEAAVQHPQPVNKARRVCYDQRGVTVGARQSELVEIDAGVVLAAAAALDGAHDLVGVVEDDAATGAVGAALGALPQAEVRPVLVGAGVEVVGVCSGGGAEGSEARPNE